MNPEGPIQKILLYVDGSEECITAAQYGVALAKETGAELKAVYVVNISLLEELVKARIFIKIEEMDYQQDLEQDGKRYLHYISEMAGSKGVSIETELVKGVVNKEVVKKIEEWHIDLLVMGELEQIHSRTDTYHDEAELIFRKAKCSVLFVKHADAVERMFESLE
ncbi:universal stress protein [candidate division KSB1 bacterium]|nr:universal stress protein [candidate division KSB1 bacterium]